MAKLMKKDQLIEIARQSGICLIMHPIETANLYLMVDPHGNNIYIGKAASKRRHREEESFRLQDYKREIYVGFAALMSENEAERVSLRYEPQSFDSSKLLKHIAEQAWTGPEIDKLSARLTAGESPSAAEVEQILIRLHVRTGRLIGNSQFASQWEGPLGSFTDTFAVLAAHTARISRLI